MDKIVIYCSSSSQVPASYKQEAAKLVAGLCAKGYGIVSGGSFRGTMGIVSDTVVKCGGYHKGVLPSFMESLVYKTLTETVWTETMAQRKEEMRRGTVAAIALPGGIGTLDELIETQVLKKLGRYPGRIIVFNPDGFFDPFFALLDHYVATGMLSLEDRNLIESFSSTEALLSSL